MVMAITMLMSMGVAGMRMLLDSMFQIIFVHEFLANDAAAFKETAVEIVRDGGTTFMLLALDLFFEYGVGIDRRGGAFDPSMRFSLPDNVLLTHLVR